MNKRKKIGVIGVDAGLCWIGDPCYFIKDKRNGIIPDRDPELNVNWLEFLHLFGENKQYTQFNYQKGHPGLGVCVHSGDGDGTYPVYAKFRKDGRIKSVTIEF